MNILIVDDDVLILDLLKKYFGRSGFSVDTATDGKTGLEMLNTKPYDIVFLDEEMPSLTGLEIVRAVRENEIDVKTVILSGYEEINEKFCRALGADAYLRKPVALEKLKKLIAQLLPEGPEGS